MINKNAMKRGIDFVSTSGWVCVFIATFMLLGAGEEFKETALMLLAFGAFTAAPGTLISVCIVIFAMRQRRSKPAA